MITLVCHRRIAILGGLVLLLASMPVLAQTQERESLTNPVFHVASSQATEQLVSTSTTEPVATTQAALQPAAATSLPTDASTAVKELAELQSTRVTPPANNVEKVASLESSKVVGNPVPAAVEEKTPEKCTLDRATRDAIKALKNMKENIADYECDFIKRERIDGKLRPTEQIKMKIRSGREATETCECVPFSVYMKFIGPRDCKNREALFVEGENNGKLLVKEGGTRGRFFPSVWLAPAGPFALSTSRYPITEVGLQRLTEKLIEGATENFCVNNECKVKYISGAKVDGHVCSYLEVIRAKKKENELLGPNNIYMAQVFLDEVMLVPIRYAAYDWPAKPGGRPKLIEEYTYRNIKLNVGLDDEDFSSKNPDYRF